VTLDRRRAPDVQQAIRDDRLRLALQPERLDRLGVDRATRERVGPLPDQDLTGAGGLLESGRHVDGIARRQALTGARDDLTTVDAGAQRQRDAVVVLELDVQGHERVPELDRCTRRAERVIVVHRRHPEDRHHRVADELLHRSAVTLQTQAGGLEVARHHAA